MEPPSDPIQAAHRKVASHDAFDGRRGGLLDEHAAAFQTISVTETDGRELLDIGGEQMMRGYIFDGPEPISREGGQNFSFAGNLRR